MPELQRRITRKKGLAIVLTEANHARMHAALTLACSAAALGRPVRLFFHGEAVCALQHGRAWGGDATYAAAGLPRLADLITSAGELGVHMMACPTGLHLCGLDAANLPEQIETGGMIAFLTDAARDELVMA